MSDWESTERAHCGPDAFSPYYEHCEQFAGPPPPVHHVPEPGTFALVLVSLTVALIVMRTRTS